MVKDNFGLDKSIKESISEDGVHTLSYNIDAEFFDEVTLYVTNDGKNVGLSITYASGDNCGTWSQIIQHKLSNEDFYNFLELDNNSLDDNHFFDENRIDFKPTIANHQQLFVDTVAYIRDCLEALWSNERDTKVVSYRNGDTLLIRNLSEEVLQEHFSLVKFFYEKRYGKMDSRSRDSLPPIIYVMTLNTTIVDVALPKDVILSDFIEISDGYYKEADYHHEWVTYFTKSNKIYSVEKTVDDCEATCNHARDTYNIDLSYRPIQLNLPIKESELIGKDWRHFDEF